MKVYIVTDGEYSDYTIEKVFSNRHAAEEYKKWHNIYNEIEEYDVQEEPFTDTEEKVMCVNVYGHAYPEAIVDIKYNIRHDTISSDTVRKAIHIGSCRPDGLEFLIGLFYCVPENLWDEEKYKAKFTKALYDYTALTKSMFADGATAYLINEALNKIIKNESEEEN